MKEAVFLFTSDGNLVDCGEDAVFCVSVVLCYSPDVDVVWYCQLGVCALRLHNHWVGSGEYSQRLGALVV